MLLPGRLWKKLWLLSLEVTGGEAEAPVPQWEQTSVPRWWRLQAVNAAEPLQGQPGCSGVCQVPQTPVTVHPPMAERGQLTEDARSQPASQERKAEFVLSEGSL